MGVDHISCYGLGYKLLLKETEDLSIFEVAEEIDCLDENFKVVETGSGAYTGKDNNYFIVIKDPFKHGLDLTKVKQELDSFIENNSLTIEGDFDEVGGLLVC